MTEGKKLTQLSEQEQQELMAKYDSESRTRQLTGLMSKVVIVLLLAFSIFQLYTGYFGELTAYLQRTIHLGFALVLIFLLFPARKKGNRKTIAWYDYILALLSVIVCGYWPVFYETLVQKIGGINQTQLIIGGLAIILVMEATRRVVGLPLVIVAAAFLTYAYFGPYMPGFLAHRGIDINQLVEAMFFTTEGILGTPLQVSSTFIFLFILFGAFLMQTGIGNYFNDLALSIAGRRVGGPAKVAVFTSALQGTISGSSVANVVQSGSYTIPIMKRLGYRKNFAGAVEAAASTGGQIMPPVMGAAAFLMVEFAGVPYIQIVLAAIIPALLYFSGIWIMVHLEAKKQGLSGVSNEDIPNKKEVLKGLYLLTPILAIVVFIYMGYSISRAAIYGIVFTLIVSLFRKDTRITLPKLFKALTDGARSALGVAAATACAGMIVGVISRTGLGLKLGNEIVGLANQITETPMLLLLLTLFFTMITSIIIGMGSPTTANYIITSTIALPVIMTLEAQFNMGIPVLAAHMFVFYFGIVADITPPVALAAFAATGISGGEPIRTGFNASRLAIAAFIIPYMFMFNPAMLMIDTNVWEIIWIGITALTGMVALGGGLIGYWYKKLNWIERIISLIIGLMLVYPGGFVSAAGLGLFFAMIAYQFIINKGKGTGADVEGASV
jgi:TRAP transporter 4TM/12TM fusion protein